MQKVQSGFKVAKLLHDTGSISLSAKLYVWTLRSYHKEGLDKMN